MDTHKAALYLQYIAFRLEHCVPETISEDYSMSHKPHPARNDAAEPKETPTENANGEQPHSEPAKKKRRLVSLSPKLAALNAVEELFGEHDVALHCAMIRHAAETFGTPTDRDEDNLDRLADAMSRG